MDITVAIDAMSGDHGVDVTVPAALRFLRKHSGVRVILVGQAEVIHTALKTHRTTPCPRLQVQAATEIVAMGERPQAALRTKKNSSMRVAIELVKSGQAQACISAGNTGALMAIACFVLKTIDGVVRPAIAKMLPTMTGQEVCALDLGANINCNAVHLAQFAVMGSALVSAISNKERPKVGLLNVGTEETKGHLLVKKAAELLRNSSLNFYGNVEGNDLYTGVVDVVVSDGFTGNVALKTSEGLSKMLKLFLHEEFNGTWWTRFIRLLAFPILRRFKHRIDTRRYNGASFLGIKGVVVKSHGAADVVAFYWALCQAMLEVSGRVTERISLQIQKELSRLSSTEAVSQV